MPLSGKKEQALSESRRAVNTPPSQYKDSINGALVGEYLAVTYAWVLVKPKDAALEQLKRGMTQ